MHLKVHLVLECVRSPGPRRRRALLSCRGASWGGGGLVLSQSPGASLSREGVPGYEEEDSAIVTAKSDALVQFYFLILI